jgi:hypothetical protein
MPNNSLQPPTSCSGFPLVIDQGGALYHVERMPQPTSGRNGKRFYAKPGSRRADKSAKWPASASASATLIRASSGKGRAADRYATDLRPNDLSAWPPLGVSAAALSFSSAASLARIATGETAGTSGTCAAARTVPLDPLPSNFSPSGYAVPLRAAILASRLLVLSSVPVPPELRVGHLPYLDVNGNMKFPSGLISQTETVWMACQILCTARVAPMPASGDLAAASYFRVPTESGLDHLNLPDPVRTSINHWRGEQLKLERFRDSLDLSATFRGLLRLAIHRGRFGAFGQDGWTIGVAPAVAFQDGNFMYSEPFVPDTATRLLYLPPYGSESIRSRYYLCKRRDPHRGQEVLQPMGSAYWLLRALVYILTGVAPARHELWTVSDGSILPAAVATLGAGERGTDYLVQRILRELSPDAEVFISPLPFMDSNLVIPPGKIWPVARLNDAMQQALHGLGGIEMMRRYVEWQDEYIEAYVPLGTV